MVARDKVWHCLASMVLVWVFFGLIHLYYRLFYGKENEKHPTTARNEDNNKNQRGDENTAAGDQNNDKGNHCQTTGGTPSSQNNQSTDRHSCCMVYLLKESGFQILLASTLSFLVGGAKEFLDLVWNGWPWCNGVCNADGWDVLANLLGITTGALILVILVFLVNNRK